MARRRSRRDKLLYGLGEGIAGASSALFRSSLADKQNDRILDRQSQASMRTFLQQVVQKVATGEITPDQAAAIAGGSASDFTSMRPGLGTRLAPVAEAIGSADTPEAVPGLEQIFGAADTAGEPNMAGLLDFARRGGVGLDSLLGEAPQAVQTLAQSAGVRRRALQEKPTERVDVQLPTGVTSTRMVSPYDLRGGGIDTGLSFEDQGRGQGVIAGATLKAGPTPQTLGTRAGQQEVAQLEAGPTPEVLGQRAATEEKVKLEGLAEVQARVANYYETMTRGARVESAQQLSGAKRRGELAPGIVDAEVERAKRIAAETPKEPTAAERTAASNMVPLLQAHDIALRMEDRVNDRGERVGVTMQPFAATATNYPLFNSYVSSEQQEYIQAAKNFTNTLGKITSGVTVREDERDNFLSVMFAQKGDSDEVIKQKQASRELFIAAAQMGAGRSRGEAGRALAQAINAGTISSEVLVTLQMKPEFESALVQALDPMLVPQLPGGGQ
jgi:hypothetical protein